MRLKYANVRAGHADVVIVTATGEQLAGEVYHADEIINERGHTVTKAGWVPVTLSRISHANPPQFPRYLSRAGAAWALAHGEVVY